MFQALYRGVRRMFPKPSDIEHSELRKRYVSALWELGILFVFIVAIFATVIASE